MRFGKGTAMTTVRFLREDESPPTESHWVLIELTGPVWVVNSATYSEDVVPSDPIGPFHTRGDAVKAATNLAQEVGIDVVYVRGPQLELPSMNEHAANKSN